MKFSVIGGDLRLSKLAIMLKKDGEDVQVFGMENEKEILKEKEIKKCKDLQSTIDNSDVIIGSIPFLKSNGEMYATFSDEHIKIEDFIKKQHKDKIFIAGGITKHAKEELEKCYARVVDIMEREELVILNTIATAEGAIDVAIQNTDKVLHGSKVLILGFGRVGKIVASKFNALSCKVTCAARKDSDFAWIKAYGYEAVNIYKLKKDLKQYDIIINTVPKMIIDRNEMQYMKSNVLLVDLASTPGGVNSEDAQKMKLKFVWALALPGKIAPLTSAEFIKETIYNVLSKS